MPHPHPHPHAHPHPHPHPHPHAHPHPHPKLELRASPCQALLLPRGSHSAVVPPPDAVIVHSFHVLLQLQRRLATPPPLTSPLASPPLPRWRLGLRLSPALDVRLSATQYCQVRPRVRVRV